MSVKFEPKWSSAPGYTVKAIAHTRHLSFDQIARSLRVDDRDFQAILEGSKRIDQTLASSLSDTLGGSASFWVQRDAQYVASRELLAANEVAQTAPIRDLIKMGWMPASTGWQDEAREFLKFYNVTNAREWHDKYGHQLPLAHFRRSDKIRTDDMAVSAWLRRSDIETRAHHAADWSARKFRESLFRARNLTRLPDPVDFIPALQELCSQAGVIVVIVKTPPGCPVSGAAFTTSDNKRAITLSARHLSDDHFWFTFFHEAAHVLLHDVTNAPIIDELDPADDYSHFEEQANELAVQLITQRSTAHLRSLNREDLTFRGIIRLASGSGIAPGVLVGLLQHEEIIGFEQKNKLKRRYRWSESNLRMAHR